MTFYRAKSFTLSLLISNGLAMFLYTSSALGELITTKRLIEANSANLESAYNNNITAASINLWIGVYSATCYNVSHWVFAFKYWTVAMQLEWLKKGQNPNKRNRFFFIVLILGILTNCFTSWFFQLSLSKSINSLTSKRLAITALSF